MSLFDGLFAGRRRVKLTDPATWHFETGSWANKAVTPDSVLQLATAWACIRLNARTIGALPLQVFERVSDGERRLATDHPLYELIHDTPNADQTAMEFWEGEVAAQNIRGNAYAEKHFNGGRLIAITPMSPDLTTVYRTPQGERRYRYSDPVLGGQDWGEDKVFHLRGFGAGGMQGLSPIHYGRQTLGTALAADEVAGRTFANGLQLAGFVEMATGTKVTEKQREELVALFQKFAGSTQAGKVMPLDPGMSFKGLGMTPEDAQLLETRGFHVDEICRWFGVPPILVGHASAGQTMWGTGVEQIMLAWLTFSLQQELERIEQAIEKQLLSPADRRRYYVEHNIESLLRADSAGRAALYSSAGQNGWMDRNEIRAKENLGPRPGAGVLTVQSNLVPLDKLGTLPPRGVQPAPGEPV
jgi:HK97 family phage portal protein